MKRTVKKIVEWGREKHIDHFYPQFGKVIEELGELVTEVNHGRNEPEKLADAIGDTFVTLIILADILGYDVEDCIKKAWKEIQNRTGHLENGVFVKDND